MTTQLTPITPEAYREGMSNLAGAVNVVTTDGPAGKAGFTATAVCSVSDDPATLLVCLNRSTSVHSVFNENTHIAINTLMPEHEPLSNLFGGKAPMQDRFAAGNWETLTTGAPVLSNAAVNFDCIITERESVATHDVIFCQVIDIKINPQAGALLYLHRAYCPIPSSQ
ncbi:flavin reductase [Alteromonas sp. a30]|uniref:flavin reductase n=1 Tax=Alteromonas sp. a30 TaxID=2730917 RepID=UPI002280C29E|nr:flavin reductase [Alteromonas sp. a30]MCY7296914.1 FMN reductase [Alteromonas sp. a30]